MPTRQNSFFVTLTSNTSLDLYPKNTLSRFTTKLPITLDFKNNHYDEWSVGIVKFCCTKIEGKIKPSSVPRIVFIDVNKEIADQTIVPVMVSIKKPNTYVFEINEILKIHPELLELINMKKFFDRYTDDDVILPIQSFGKNTISVLVEKRKCLLTVDKEYSMRNLFDTLLAQISKDERTSVVESLKKSAKTPLKTLDNKNTVAIKRIAKVIQPETEDTPSEEYGIPNYMCIYCDMVQPQMFGNVMARGMLMHPVKYQKQYDSYQNCDIVNVQYLPIENSRITDISILIVDENGEQINFKRDSFSTMVVLHFRKGI